MADLIDRQTIIEAIHSAIYPYFCGAEDGDALSEDEKLVLSVNKTVCTAIKALPSVDVQPVRHGHWIRGSGYPHHIFCSICYATYVPNDEWDIWKTDGSDCFRLQRNFCPYCGARMELE